MRSSFKRIGLYVQQVNARNSGLSVTNLQGVSINKLFIPSVANINGTDLSTYKVVSKEQFAFNPMHVGRDEVLPIAMLETDDPVIVSPAYVVFEITDKQVLLPEYLMMWCRRPEFDRNAWFTTDSSVRGGFSWDDFCEMEFPVPSPEKQQEIVTEYNTIVDRIKLNKRLSQKLEETAQAIYKQWFVDFEFPIPSEYAAAIGKPEIAGQSYQSSGGEMVYNEVLKQEIPKGWEVCLLEDLCALITKGTTPEMMFSEKGSQLISFIKGETITDSHGINGQILMFIDEKTNRTLRRSIIKEGDILFSIAGTLGKYAFVNRRTLPANCNQAVSIIRIETTKINRSYIMGLFLSQWHTMFYSKNVQQAVQANLSLSTIRSLPVIKPPLEILNKIKKVSDSLVDYLQTSNTEKEVINVLLDTLLQKIAVV